MMTILIACLIIILFAAVILWVLDTVSASLGIPANIYAIIRIIVVLIALVAIFEKVSPLLNI